MLRNPVVVTRAPVSKPHLSSPKYRLHTTTTTTSEKKPILPPSLVPFKSFGIGTVAGTMGSLAGMGGGFVMIPMMTGLLKLTQHQAHGTSLFAVMTTGLAGAVSYGDQVDYPSAAAIALTGIFSARLGAKATSVMSEKALKQALGVLMLVMAPAVPAKKYIMEKYATKDSSDETLKEEKSMVEQLAPSAAIGMFSGFLAGVFGVGGGVIVVPALAVFTDMNHVQCLATSLAAMCLPAAAGTYAHYTAGNVAMRVAPFLAAGAFTGAYVGGQVAVKTDEATLQWGFSGLLTVLGLRTLLKV